MEGAGQVYRKSGVAAAVVEHPPPVAEHRGVVGHGPEGEQDGAALPFSGRKKLPPVARKLLVVVLIAVIVGQSLDRVGQAHLFQLQLRGLRPHDGGGEDRGELPAVIPIVVFHHKCSPWQRILLFLCYHKVMNEKRIRAGFYRFWNKNSKKKGGAPPAGKQPLGENLSVTPTACHLP